MGLILLSGTFTRGAGLNTGNYTFDYQYDSVSASAQAFGQFSTSMVQSNMMARNIT